MRVGSRLVAGLLGAAALIPVGAGAASAEDWNLHGSGFGHGVGMSQYGAKSMAESGKSAEQILQYYYPGTTYDKVVDTAIVSVNVRHSVSSTTLTGSARAAGGGTLTIAAGGKTLTAPAGHSVTISRSGSGVVVRCASGCSTSSISGPSAQVTYNRSATLASVDGKKYAVGTVSVTPTPGSSTLEVVVKARMHDEYLDYLREMPWSWPRAALETQAAAARSYALRKVNAGIRSSCACHVYDTQSDQVFGTYPSSFELSYHPRWKAAVRASGSSTTGYVPRYNGALIEALYSSSHGGWSQANEDVWGGAPVPYLRSVYDPWSLTKDNPRRSWTKTVPEASLAGAFGLRDIERLDLSRRTKGHGVDVAVATSSSGATSSMDGETFKARLGLSGVWVRRPYTRSSYTSRSAEAAMIARRSSIESKNVVIAGQYNSDLIDVMAARPFASSMGAPLLLSGKSVIPKATLAELERRKGRVTTVYLVGSTASMSSAVESSLKAKGLNVRRIGYTDPYSRTARVAEMTDSRKPVNAVVVASKSSLPSGYSFTSVMSVRNEPLLLVRPSSLPGRTEQALDRINPRTAHVVGSSGTVSTSVTGALYKKDMYVRRFSGDRYAVAEKVAGAFTSSLGGGDEMVIAAGGRGREVDAAIAGGYRRPVLPANGSSLPGSSKRALQTTAGIGRLRIVGDDEAVPLPAARSASEA